MKIQNISIENINLDNNSAKLLFEIVDATENVSVYLKINENDYQEIFTNKTNGNLEYDLTNLPKGVNNATLKLTNATSEYITEPFLIKMVINPIVQDMVCSYSDSKGNYILEFIFTGDTLLKYNIYLSLDNKDYKEVLNNQISGKKSIKDIDIMGTHKAVLKVNDGYDDFIFEEFQFDIKNHKPQLSSVLVTDIKLDGSCQIHYGVKDYEDNELTHRLNIDGNYISLTPTNINYFYTYNILGLQTGEHDCFIEVSDGIDTVKTETVTVEIFSNTQNKKRQLYQAKTRYDEAYKYLKEIITSVVKDGIFDYDVENNIKQKAFDNYNMEYSNFNKIAQQSIDIIGNNKVTKAKEEINQEILDVENAMNTLEDTMNTTFKDGILSDSEKDTLNNTLNLIAKEKDDIDSDYEVLYNNEDLINTAKTNLKNAYDNFITSHNNLVLAIDGIINKTGIIDNNDKTRIDNAFSDWRNKLGAYRTASMEAIDSIAKKKADDSADIVNKRWADIILGEDGIQSQVGNLQQTISGDGGIEERLKTAEQTITTEGISNLIKDTYYSKQEIDEQLDATVAQVEVLYYLSTSIDSLVDGKWSSTTPTWEEGKYVWTKTVSTLTDGTVKESAPVCITNTIDMDLEEIKLYTWIRYADDEKGNGITNDPTGKDYIGFAYNKLSEIESDVPGDYQWSLIRGEDGVPGKDGNDGKTLYTWIKYSDNEDGSELYDIPNENTNYIGISTNNESQTESTNKEDYRWSKFKGEDGVDGTSIKILGKYNTIEELNQEHPSNNENGDTYIVNGDLYVWTVDSFENVGRMQGNNGRGIVSITPQYYLSTSGIAQENGDWVIEPPTWEIGKYLWIRHEIIYENPSSTEYTTPVLDGNWKGLTDLQEQLDNTKTEIETTKETIAEHTTSLNDITSRVSTTESNITKINGDITNVTERVSEAEQKITEDAITNTVKKSFYTKTETDEQIDTQMSTVEQTVNSWGVKITQNEQEISSLKLTDESFDVTIKNKADKSNIISMINASTEGITISSSKVNISGFVTFSDLSTSGKTTINGSNITTGTINASKATITNINASNITTGTLSGNYIRGGEISGTTLRTATLGATTGVAIEANGIKIGATALFFNNSRFDLQTKSACAIGSMGQITLMAGLNSDGTASGSGVVSVPNATLNAQKLTVVNNATIQGACAVSGQISCSGLSAVNSIAATNGFSSSNGGLVVTGTITTNSGNINANNGQVSCKTLKVSSSTSFGSLSCSSLTSSGAVTGKNVQLNTGSIWLGTTNSSVTASYVKMGTGGYMAAYSGFHFINSGGSPHTLRAGTIYANGTSVSSDERLKTDIKYVDVDKQELTSDGLMSPNVNITTSDMHDFVETIPIVSYRLIDELNENRDNTHYGFLIQDIMETKVGSELTEIPKDGYGNETDGYYTYSQDKFIAFICGALQKEIKLRKELEEKVSILEEKINKE